ncbi:MAG: hypothetical protein ACD_10C00695G0002 [uncultured bacterium]|nr:MAG: hypothetical protein ACD_10C00695G0002 [uncultured bacterium]
MNGHAEDFAIDPELLISADPVAIGGQQSHLVGAVAHHRTRRQLGCGSGFAHAGRPDQRIHAAFDNDVISRIRYPQIAFQYLLDPGFSLHVSGGHFVQQLTRQQCAETGIQHSAQQSGALRVALLHIVP